ncbi:carbohydrate ABC transporter permease [Streptomyces jeddahensis]|uniref:Inner membrane ABC transporter permease protein YcjP n=1 Tax=Streptomyces jeddahensis TaxID=1716141 RepID=A0A177HTC8_9ACTN|nr:carbohydrate ABC transporter permease [Streptomyces jeddahensis]OAH14241.1 inner membrane ABC transporter permease protein YcjP [Streptomyces jeddahensis]
MSHPEITAVAAPEIREHPTPPGADGGRGSARPSLRRRREPRRVHETRVDRMFLFCTYLLLCTFLAVVLLPLLNIVASSFSDPVAVNSGRVLFWPVDFSLRGYEVALRDPQIITGFLNSLFYTVVGTLVSVTLTVALAYPLSRKDLFGRGPLMGVVVFTMLFSGGLIPTYLVVQELGLLNTRWSLIVPQAIGVWQVVIASTYFRTMIPDELYEAAQLDGCGDLRFLWKVVLPLAKPMLAVVALMYAIAQWNSYFDALLYLKDADLYPIQLVLRNILILNTSNVTDASLMLERQQLADLLKYSLIVIASVPVLLIYPFVARYFTKGIMIGAIKG